MREVSVNPKPFPHLLVDGWWDDQLLRDVLAEFPDEQDPRWRRYDNDQERKHEGPPAMWGHKTRRLIDQVEARTPELETLFGIPDLLMETVGGGYHCIRPGGYLNIHADFNKSPRTGNYRRLNLLIYLNDDWQDPGGRLELWDDNGCVESIAPEFNRTVVFQTSDRSWHGHPTPAQRIRKSVAAYFFTVEPPDGYSDEHSTVWHKLGN